MRDREKRQASTCLPVYVRKEQPHYMPATLLERISILIKVWAQLVAFLTETQSVSQI